MEYLSPIDPHVHLRGEEYAKDFLEYGMADARTVGLVGMVEQPNPKPQLTTEKIINERLNKLNNYSIPCHIHIGMTNDKNQVIDAINMIMQRRVSRCCSDKIFYTHSTGNMGILDVEFQRWIWQKKAEMQYSGISIGHFEDEESYLKIPFDSEKPITHSYKQCPEAEYIQVERQLRFAHDAGFTGTFYVAHVSNPATVLLCEDYRRKHTLHNKRFDVVLEATWHHLFLNTTHYDTYGTYVKMNPPLRPKPLQEMLLQHLLRGEIDIIGTDHAPHPIEKKTGPNAYSGIPAILFWPYGIKMLKDLGMKTERIEYITSHKANILFFHNSLKTNIIKLNFSFEEMNPYWKKYDFNPFSAFMQDTI